MRSTRRTFLRGTLALALAGLPSRATAQARGGTLKVSYPEPTHLNPAIVSGTPTGIPGVQLFAGLVTHDDKFQPHPYLAERWTISPDGRTYTFQLVKHATFHDGKPVTSEDVKFSIETVKANHPFGVAMHRSLEAVETPNPHTVVFRLAYPNPAFMSVVAPILLPILPRHVYGDGDIRKNPANLKPVGSGPFRFVEFQKGRHLILERNDRFFLPGQPLLDRIIFEYIPDPSARMAAFETGAIHMMPYNYAGLGNLKRIETLPFAAITMRGYEAIGPLSWVEINLRKKELSDVRVRRALAHALDKNLIVKDILLGYGKVADGPLVSASPFYNPRLRRYEHSLDKANALLDEAGYRRGAGGTRFALVLDIIPGGGAETVSVAEYIREQGKKIGVDIQIRNSPDFPTWAGRMGNWEFELSLDAVFNWPDPTVGVERTYISSNIKKAVWTNVMGYSNPKVDDLFARAQRETNFERRRTLYHQVQDVLTEDLPLIWISEVGYTTVWNKDFEGFPMNIWGTMSPFLDVRWTKAK